MAQSIDRILIPNKIGIVNPFAQPVNFNGQYKTNPLKPDSFDKRELTTNPFSPTAKLYHQLLEAVSSDALLNEYLNENNAQKLLMQSPKAQRILNSHNLKANIDTDNVKKIKTEHIDSTVVYADRIAENLGLSGNDRKIIHKGATFHDYGKILIPHELLNKKATLNADEKKIVDLHSELGYEMLQNTPLEKEVVQIVKDHHKPYNKNPDYRTQIVTAADIYSALTTQRSYKKALSKEESLYILNNYAKMGKIDPEIILALEKSLEQE